MLAGPKVVGLRQNERFCILDLGFGTQNSSWTLRGKPGILGRRIKRKLPGPEINFHCVSAEIWDTEAASLEANRNLFSRGSKMCAVLAERGPSTSTIGWRMATSNNLAPNDGYCSPRWPYFRLVEHYRYYRYCCHFGLFLLASFGHLDGAGLSGPAPKPAPPTAGV